MNESQTRRRTDVTAVILAGGRSRRMQGLDKGLLPFRGRPLVQHVLQALAPQVDDLMIIANRHQADYRRFGVPVFADVVAGYGGPLVGVITGLAHAATPWTLFAPCDAPRIPADLVQRLQRAALASGAAYAASGADQHYTCCLLARNLRADLEAVVAGGSSAMRDGLAACGALRVDFGDDDGCLWNVNTLEALKAAENA